LRFEVLISRSLIKEFIKVEHLNVFRAHIRDVKVVLDSEKLELFSGKTVYTNDVKVLKFFLV